MMSGEYELRVGGPGGECAGKGTGGRLGYMESLYFLGYPQLLSDRHDHDHTSLPDRQANKALRPLVPVDDKHFWVMPQYRKARITWCHRAEHGAGDSPCPCRDSDYDRNCDCIFNLPRISVRTQICNGHDLCVPGYLCTVCCSISQYIPIALNITGAGGVSLR
jgi:hypothetical protein